MLINGQPKEINSCIVTKGSPFNSDFGIWLIMSRLLWVPVVMEYHIFCFLNI